jgi:hypothetical protein
LRGNAGFGAISFNTSAIDSNFSLFEHSDFLNTFGRTVAICGR